VDLLFLLAYDVSFDFYGVFTASDIDECELLYCSQGCDNLPGSYVCKCDRGYDLDYDGRTCKITGTLLSAVFPCSPVMLKFVLGST